MPRMSMKDAQRCLDNISTELLKLQQGGVDGLSSKAFVDVVARMNAQYSDLQKILDPLKTSIKDMGTNKKPTEYIRGNLFKAVLSRFKKRYFDYGKAEELLGTKKFNQCWIEKKEESLRFDIQG